VTNSRIEHMNMILARMFPPGTDVCCIAAAIIPKETANIGP
jgi:hypothetical protein